MVDNPIITRKCVGCGYGMDRLTAENGKVVHWCSVCGSTDVHDKDLEGTLEIDPNEVLSKNPDEEMCNQKL